MARISDTLLSLAVLWAAVPLLAQQQANNNTDYARRVVAFLDGGEVITRQDLGEYLLARMGTARVKDFIDRKLIGLAGQRGGVEVLDAEVEAALNDAIQGLPRERFIREIIRNQYGLSLFEWKEDRLRPKLILGKLCRAQLRYTEEEVKHAFEATYGERMQVRMIIWPKSHAAEVQGIYGKLRDDDDFFNETARKQFRSDLASSGGRLKPMGRYTTGDDLVEKAAFALKPGQVSELLDAKDGLVLLKCDGRLPADTTANLEAKRTELVQTILDQKLKAEVPKFMEHLRKQANPQYLVKDWTLRAEAGQVIATIGNGVSVTREEFGEYLIARFGVDKLEMFVNSRIINRVCTAKGITVSPQEIDAALNDYVKARDLTPDLFEQKVLRPNGQSLYEFREDFLRSQLLMAKLVRPTLKPTEDEIKLAFDAYYGEKVDCRLILFPRGEEKVALKEYPLLIASEEAFAKKAKMQASAVLAARGGRVPPIGRNTTGNEELERQIFSLNPGEYSHLIGAPEGTVLVRCDRRIPPDASKKLADVRAQLTEEVITRKLATEVPRAVAELRKAADARLLLKDPTRPEIEQVGAIEPKK